MAAALTYPFFQVVSSPDRRCARRSPWVCSKHHATPRPPVAGRRSKSSERGLLQGGGFAMTDILQQVSAALAATIEVASPGVVRVEARRRLSATGIVWSPDGVIATAHHVVEQDDPIHIGLADGQTVSATVVGRDPTTDLAVLRAQVTSLRPPAWIEPDMQSLRVG